MSALHALAGWLSSPRFYPATVNNFVRWKENDLVADREPVEYFGIRIADVANAD